MLLEYTIDFSFMIRHLVSIHLVIFIIALDYLLTYIILSEALLKLFTLQMLKANHKTPQTEHLEVLQINTCLHLLMKKDI